MLQLERMPYVCSALTELPLHLRDQVKKFLSAIGDGCEVVLGARAFVPHEHYDPVKFAHVKDIDVFDAENAQIINRTSVVVVVYLEPSWGGGAEIALAGEHNIPVLFLCPEGKKISRYIIGLTKRKEVFAGIISFVSYTEAISKLQDWLIVNGYSSKDCP